MKEYKQIGINLIKKLEYIIPIIIVAIAGYGYLLIYPTVNVDVLSGERYFEGAQLIAQGRLMAPLLEKIFGVMGFYPFWADFIAVLLLIVASILFCILWNIVSKGKIKTMAYTFFSCLFISFPLITQILPYVPMGISIGFGYCLIAIALIAFNRFCDNNNILTSIISILALWAAISLYESFASVYIMGALAILLIKILFVNEKKVKLIEHIKEGLKYLLPLIIAILCNVIVSSLILKIFNINEISNADKEIAYLEIGFINGLKNLIHSIITNYFIAAFGYLPFTILLICSIISIIMSITFSIKKRNISILVIIIGMNITLLLLSIIQGKAAIYRTCQQFSLFIAIILMLLIQITLDSKIKKWMKNMVFFGIFLVILYQVKDLYWWEYVNDLRYQNEKETIKSIGNEIVAKYNYKEKPVVFVGWYEFPQNIEEKITIRKDSLHYKVLNFYNQYFLNNKIENLDEYIYVQSSVQSYINWSMTAFVQNGDRLNIELVKFFNLLGYDIKASDIDVKTYIELLKQMKDNPNWPKEGSIIEIEDYIVVCF